MKAIFSSICIFLFFSLIITSCSVSSENPDPVNIGADYFPLKTGKYIDYQITENIYTPTNPVLTNIYQRREQVSDTFKDIDGNIAYKLLIYSRKTNTDNWKLDSVWVAKLYPSKATKTESNITYIKLLFPLKEGQQWDGNSFNGIGADQYTLKDLGLTYKIDTFTFSKSLKVIQSNDSSLVKLNKASEIYAQNIGLVYKESKVLEYCSSTPSCVGKGQISFGRTFIQKVINYGSK